MKTKLLSALAIAILPGLCGAAAAQPACLEIGSIWNWKVVDPKTLIVEDNWHQKFRLKLMFSCTNIQFKERVGFKTIGGFSGLSCLSKGDEVLVHDIAIPSHCPIVDITRYTPAMEKADLAAKAQAAAPQPPAPPPPAAPPSAAPASPPPPQP
jgi:hypothetical protein